MRINSKYFKDFQKMFLREQTEAYIKVLNKTRMLKLVFLTTFIIYLYLIFFYFIFLPLPFAILLVMIIFIVLVVPSLYFASKIYRKKFIILNQQKIKFFERMDSLKIEYKCSSNRFDGFLDILIENPTPAQMPYLEFINKSLEKRRVSIKISRFLAYYSIISFIGFFIICLIEPLHFFISIISETLSMFSFFAFFLTSFLSPIIYQILIDPELYLLPLGWKINERYDFLRIPENLSSFN